MGIYNIRGLRYTYAGKKFPNSAPTIPAHLSVIGGAFLLESVVRYAALVRCPEFGGCPLFGSSKCIASTEIAVGTSTEVRYTEDVRYWEGPLSEVPLYIFVRDNYGTCAYRRNTHAPVQNEHTG